MMSSRRLVRRGRSVGLRPRRRSWEWEAATTSTAATFAAASVSAVEWLSAAEIDEMGESTFTRVRGEVIAQLTGAPVTPDSLVLAFGLCALPSQSLAGTTTTAARVVPAPFTDSNWHGWLLNFYLPMSWRTNVEVGDQLMAVRRPFDSRGQRRLHEEEHLLLVIESVVSAGVAANLGCQFTFVGRMLMRLAR